MIDFGEQNINIPYFFSGLKAYFLDVLGYYPGCVGGAVSVVEPDEPRLLLPQLGSGASRCFGHVCVAAAILLPTFTALNPRLKDGEVRPHDVKDGPRLSEHDILGKLLRYGQFLNMRHTLRCN